jgi:starch synthase (maltosyl-transferring)
MKIDLVITELHPGGAERCCTSLALYLHRHHHRVRVLSLGERSNPSKARLVEALEGDGIEVQHFGARSISDFPRVRAHLRRAVAVDPPELAQAFLWHANLLSSLVYPARKIPWIAGVRVVEPRRWRALISRFWARQAAHVVCVSDDVAQWCHRTEGVPRDRLSVISNGVELPDAQDINPQGMSPSPEPTDFARRSTRPEPILLFVGRMEHQKGIDQLMLHAESILKQLPHHRLVLIGDGSWAPRWQAFSESSCLAHRMEWLGHRSDVSDWMAKSELLLLPTRYEGMPNVVLEAMAHGLPIAVMRVQGIAEALGPRLADQSADAGDWEGWAKLVVRLARDEGLRHALAVENRQRAETHFALDGILQRYVDLFHATLDRQRTR